MANFYISDLHFGHDAIIRIDKRPFANMKEMDDVLISNWNNVVSEFDRVYILGDFCWSSSPKDWMRILRKLNGEKVLILGNHDLKQFPSGLRKEFAGIYHYKEIDDNGRKVILSHFPILFYNHAPNPNWYMLCGHVHGTAENDCLEAWKKDIRAQKFQGLRNCAQIYNVGCMLPHMNYTPRTLDEIVSIDSSHI